ncbi:hypothetical protein T492DRAFT_912129, partial [Pavlovales sp. CCMP2436]
MWHSPTQKPHACERCDKSFAKKSLLTSHARTHTGEKPYACESCDKSFVKKDALKSHARTHSGEKPYACESCEKRFSKHSALTVHARTHTGKKPYACESCLLRFNQASHLTHRTRRSCPRASLAAAARWASGGRAGLSLLHCCDAEKPYACESCDKAYVNKYSLTVRIARAAADR